jgi:hypothetical protein
VIKKDQFENRVWRRIFGSKRKEETGGWRNCIIRSFIIFFSSDIIREKGE